MEDEGEEEESVNQDIVIIYLRAQGRDGVSRAPVTRSAFSV